MAREMTLFSKIKEAYNSRHYEEVPGTISSLPLLYYSIFLHRYPLFKNYNWRYTKTEIIEQAINYTIDKKLKFEMCDIIKRAILGQIPAKSLIFDEIVGIVMNIENFVRYFKIWLRSR